MLCTHLSPLQARYAVHDSFTDPVEWEGFRVRLVLQCRQKPGYSVCGKPFSSRTSPTTDVYADVLCFIVCL